MLDEALDYLEAERPSAALTWFDELMEQVRTLAVFPDAGRIVPEYERAEVREILVSPYRIPYHRSDDVITILAVMHDRRDVEIDQPSR